MITPEEIEAILDRSLPGAVISAMDLTGTSDHFEVRVVWDGFRGKSLIEQHQIINRALEGALEDGRIHALKIKTFTPEQISK
ncbi:MAG: BolA/IbaG family iron-sulfur metabolism protein [Candidatus Omnitrophica bacterium]|nr:BolA/IbaG family iron-sulfur metabolism protein [Candidatus Omnitrophota bacterium]